jgi:hypothetical protein
MITYGIIYGPSSLHIHKTELYMSFFYNILFDKIPTAPLTRCADAGHRLSSRSSLWRRRKSWSDVRLSSYRSITMRHLPRHSFRPPAPVSFKTALSSLPSVFEGENAAAVSWRSSGKKRRAPASSRFRGIEGAPRGPTRRPDVAAQRPRALVRLDATLAGGERGLPPIPSASRGGRAWELRRRGLVPARRATVRRSRGDGAAPR